MTEQINAPMMGEMKRASGRLSALLPDLDAAGSPTKCEVFTACGGHARVIADDLRTLLARTPPTTQGEKPSGSCSASPSVGENVPSASTAHFGDPCVFCGVAHDDVAPGPCPKNDGKLRVAGYAGLGVRWDGVESFRYRTTDGRVHELCSHVSNHSPYYHFGLSDELTQPPPYDASLKGQG